MYRVHTHSASHIEEQRLPTQWHATRRHPSYLFFDIAKSKTLPGRVKWLYLTHRFLCRRVVLVIVWFEGAARVLPTTTRVTI